MAASDISVRDTPKLLEGSFEPFAAGVSNGLYAFWLGSGISFGRAPSLRILVGRVVEFVRSRIIHADPNCKFARTLQEILNLVSASADERAATARPQTQFPEPFNLWELTVHDRLFGDTIRLPRGRDVPVFRTHPRRTEVVWSDTVGPAVLGLGGQRHLGGCGFGNIGSLSADGSRAVYQCLTPYHFEVIDVDHGGVVSDLGLSYGTWTVLDASGQIVYDLDLAKLRRRVVDTRAELARAVLPGEQNHTVDALHVDPRTGDVYVLGNGVHVFDGVTLAPLRCGNRQERDIVVRRCADSLHPAGQLSAQQPAALGHPASSPVDLDAQWSRFYSAVLLQSGTNYDLTLSPRFLSKRGFQLGADARYVDYHYDGQARFEYLPNDEMFGRSRYAYRLDHRQSLGRGFSATINWNGVSDDYYWQDLSSRLLQTSQVQLPRQVVLGYTPAPWLQTSMQVLRYQTLQLDPNNPVAHPYFLEPQLNMLAYKPNVFKISIMPIPTCWAIPGSLMRPSELLRQLTLVWAG